MQEPIPVLVTLRFTEEQLQRLRSVSPRLSIRQESISEDREDTSAFLNGTEQIIYAMTPPRDLSQAPHLKWVQLHSAGIDHLKDHPLWKTDIQVTTSSGIHAVPIGEFVFALLLGLARKLPKMVRSQERADWPRHRWEVLIGTELRGKTIGIIGYGSIGREVARIAAEGFSMRVLAIKQSGGPSRARFSLTGVGDLDARIPERWFSADKISDLLAESDFVALCLPLTEASKKLIGRAELKAMKRTAFLINIARGELIDEYALVQALKEGWIAGAGLDAFTVEPLPRDSQLWHLDNVIISPHIAAATPHYDDRAVVLFAENLRRFLDGEPLLNLVDRNSGY